MTDSLPYDAFLDDALRSVMARALAQVAGSGLPGGHHFYIAFRTDHPGVVMDEALAARHRPEMTVVLQHRFWGLAVDDEGFRVGLSFEGRPHSIRVPFAAVTSFVDPSVRFGLQFGKRAGEAPGGAGEQAGGEEEQAEETGAAAEAKEGNVVAFDRFRKT